MKILITLALLGLGFSQTSPPVETTKPTLSGRQEVLKSEIAISTLPAADLKGLTVGKPIEHDSKVARSEAVTVIVTIQGCQADAKGVCNASADVVAYKPDG